MNKIITIVAVFFTLIANAQTVSIPDANFKAKLLSASSSNTIASTEAQVYNATNGSWSVISTYSNIDTSGDGEIQVSEALAIKYLDLSASNISNLSGIESFTNLQNLICENNQIGILDVSQNTALTKLNCGNNPFTSLDISQNTILISLDCPFNQLNTINFSQNNALIWLDCNNGLINSLDVSQCLLLKTLYCEGNQISNLNISQNSSLQDLNASDTLLQSFEFPIFSNPSAASEFSFSGCNLLQFINTKNGSWNSFIMDVSGCSNLQYICKDENEGLNILDDGTTNNFQVGSYCSFVPNGNYNTISGTATYDNENDGCDSSNANFEFLRIEINGATTNGATFTNSTGNYNFYTPAGNFTITPQLENPTYFNVSPTSAVVNFANNNNNTTTQNFCITPNGVHTDVEVVFAPIDAARPGFDATYLVVYKNKGNQTVSGTIATTFNDNILDFVSATNVPTSVSTGQLTWDYTNLVDLLKQKLEHLWLKQSLIYYR